MLFPKVPIGELAVGDTFLDTDGLEWTILSKLPRTFEFSRYVEVSSSLSPTYRERLEIDELVSIDQMSRALTAGRCKRCEIVYVWPRRHRVLLSRAICKVCGRGLTQTSPRMISPHGKRAYFECPRERPTKPAPKDDGPPALKRLLKL